MTDSAYAGTLWVCERLGRKPDWFYRNKPKLIENGFPDKDPLTNLWIKADVDAWINARRSIRDTNEAPKPTTGANLNGL